MNKETQGFINPRLVISAVLNGLFLSSLFYVSMEWFNYTTKCDGLACIGIIYYALVVVIIALLLTPIVYIGALKIGSLKNYLKTLVAFSAGFAVCVIVVLFVFSIISYIKYEIL